MNIAKRVGNYLGYDFILDSKFTHNWMDKGSDGLLCMEFAEQSVDDTAVDIMRDEMFDDLEVAYNVYAGEQFSHQPPLDLGTMLQLMDFFRRCEVVGTSSRWRLGGPPARDLDNKYVPYRVRYAVEVKTVPIIGKDGKVRGRNEVGRDARKLLGRKRTYVPALTLPDMEHLLRVASVG